MEALSRASPCDSLPPPEAPGRLDPAQPRGAEGSGCPLSRSGDRGGVSSSTSPEEGGRGGGRAKRERGGGGGRSCNREGLCKES